MKPATKRRFEEMRRRKNFLPTLSITIILWILIAIIVIFTDPLLSGAVPLFFATAFFSLVFTFSLILGNTRRGVAISLVFTIFGILRYFGVGNIINFALLVGAVVAFEFYFTRKIQ